MLYPRKTLLFATLALSGLPALAQSPNGNVNGLVLDPSSQLIAGAEVIAVNDVTGVRYSTKTNNEGIYVLPNLPPGPYRVQVSKIGFKTVIKPDIVLNVQDAISLNFTLPIGATLETVTVEGGAPLVDTESAAVSTVVDRKFVENTPLNGRSFQDLIALTPGVVTQSPQTLTGVGYFGDFSVNGQRTETNYYTVDGVSGNTSAGGGNGYPNPPTSGSIAASTALGTTQSLVSVDALQEFRIQSSSYSAEYGRNPGGQFSFVTRSGTNQVHGALFNYLRNDFFDANDWFNDHFGKSISALRQNNFGGTLGGPIVVPELYNGKNRTFFFFSYEGLRLTQPQAATLEYVPDSYMRQQAPAAIQPILNAFPVANGQDFGTSSSPGLAQFIEPYSLPSQIDATSIRIDHTYGSRLTLFFRFADTPSSITARDLSSLTNIVLDTRTYTLGATSRFSNRLTDEFRLGYSRAHSAQSRSLDGFGGATPINLAQNMGDGGFLGSQAAFYLIFSGFGVNVLTTSRSTNDEHQWNLLDTLNYSSGHHQLKFGGDYRRIESPTLPTSPIVSALFFNPQSVLSNNPNSIVLDKLEKFAPVFNEFAAFGQDVWQVRPKLTLSLGLRWEVDPPLREAHGNDPYTISGNISKPGSLSVAPQGTPLWRTTWYNFAPRLGAAWQVRHRPGWQTVVRAGGGVFFDTDNQLATSGFEGIGFLALQSLSNTPLPVTPAQLSFNPSATAPYTSAPVYAFPVHLQLPYTLQWNASVQQAMGRVQALTISYVGSSGRRLIQQEQLDFQPLNSNFGTVYYTRNAGTSDYDSAQVQFQRTLSRGLQGLASYTWSHCIDFGSNDVSLALVRGNCDFDIRHNFQGGISWDLPAAPGSIWTRALLRDWGFDGRVMARAGFPVTLQGNFLTNPATGSDYFGSLNLVPGKAVYVYGPQYPGGHAINPAAFSLPSSGQSGDAPRNFVRGFGAWQLNMAIRRDFPIFERLHVQFRAEAFNLLNHPNFGYVDPTLTDSTFGQATQMLNQSLATVASQYQQGGPRSLQFALRLAF